MLERHTLIRLDDGERRAAHRHELMDDLASLLRSLPMVATFRLGEASDVASLASWDIAMVVCFHDEASLAGFGAHTLYQEFAQNRLTEGVACVKAWTFEFRR